jgi:hypothetical protein
MPPTVKSIAVAPDGGEARWFLGTLAIVKIDGVQTGGRFAIFESHLPHEAAPPDRSHRFRAAFLTRFSSNRRPLA